MAKQIVYSYDKNRKVEESYKFTLPEQYRKIAQEELQENEIVREQALTQMREWIVSNPHIRKCRVDASFLLRFLRFRKFSVPLACEALEQYLTVREMYPSWHKKLDINDPEMRRLQETMGLSVLGQDSVGRTIILVEGIDVEKGQFEPQQIGRYVFTLLEVLLESEEVQIGGILALLDYSGLSMEVFKRWGATELKIVFDGFARYYPIRFQEVHAANVPKVITSFLEYILTFGPAKFNEKIQCHATVDKLIELMEPSMAPQAYGGPVNLDELNKQIWERFRQQYESFILGLDQFEIDYDHYSAQWNKQHLDMAEAKAFKNLEVD